MKVGIERVVFEKYPAAEIGYLTAQVSVQKTDPYVEALKKSLGGYLEKIGINATNFASHPSLSIWRKIYQEDFQVNAKTYRSSIEALIRRIVTGKELWNICSVVDLYNCSSVLSLLPMGGYDLRKVTGDITIRYAKEGEIFRGLGEKEDISTMPNHVVYADAARVLCWLWNHKDSRETCIEENTTRVVFFIDSILEGKGAQLAVKQLIEDLKKIQGVPLDYGILNRTSPQVYLGEVR